MIPAIIPRQTLPALAEKVVEAYGGVDRWSRAREVHATVSASGLLFRMKGRPVFRNARVVVGVRRPRARITPIDKKGHVGVLDGDDVRLENEDRRTIASRAAARRSFPGGRRGLWWDVLDMTYFAGYAFWNYLTFPALILRDDIAWEQIEADVLEARFPAALPTHSAVQRFTIDPATGRLRRHDYVAEIIGPWASAANVVVSHGESGGVPFVSRRRVTPVLPGGKPAPIPVLVDIVVHDWELTV